MAEIHEGRAFRNPNRMDSLAPARSAPTRFWLCQMELPVLAVCFPVDELPLSRPANLSPFPKRLKSIIQPGVAKNSFRNQSGLLQAGTKTQCRSGAAIPESCACAHSRPSGMVSRDIDETGKRN